MALVALNSAFNSFHGRVDGLVFVYRHGRQHVRPCVKPRNSTTSAHRALRRAFAGAVRAWHLLSGQKTLWNISSQRSPSNGYNAFLSWYVQEGVHQAGSGRHPASSPDPVFRTTCFKKPGAFVFPRSCNLFRDITAPFHGLFIIYPGSGTRLQRKEKSQEPHR